MQFDSYISDLLYRYECVIIPDFGAFLTRSVPAHIDESTHTFYPPSKIVSFNEQLKNNDGLLANYVASVEKVPYELALKKVLRKTKSLKSYLAQGETLSFKHIGEVQLAANGRIRFEPTNDLNYLTQSFGLHAFVSPHITREDYKVVVEEIEEAVPIALTSEKRHTRNYLKYAAVAVIALSLGGLISSNYYLNQIERHNELAAEEAQKELESRIQEATFVIENPLPTISLEVDKQSGNYHVVAGAFRIESNCNSKLQELKDLGYKAHRIGINKYGLHQVVYGSYESRREAQRELYKIRRAHNKDAWLLIQELD
ncbi:MAG: SPOR domain-containing protein [Bacteroidia bacterium]|nr:SPOR domain-containing protein [Bacteroidia bacterium]MBT8287266.1 SPOR domain-containing protein [Bacteroidia bacterium]NNK73852.1 HU-CCDC81 and SPOR domain-containing protein [Flavobacteriaceae bacterium]